MKNIVDKQYIELLEEILNFGEHRDDRTGTGTISIFGGQMKIDLRDGFPLLTTKKVYYPGIIHELLWFLRGDTNIQYLRENNVRIWNEWANSDGDLGPIYSSQWTRWGGNINQIANVVESLRRNPNSRRHVVSAWNPTDLPDESISPQANVDRGKMALAPCHCLFQFYVNSKGLSCHLYSRSCDAPIGLPYNIASYALLVHMISNQIGTNPHELTISFGDVHIYKNCLDGVKEQIERVPFDNLPTLHLNPDVKDIFSYRFEDFEISGYQSHPPIKFQISV